MRSVKFRGLEALRRHRWRYIAFIVGFLLLVHPFALLIRTAYSLLGSPAEPNLHRVCFRMPIDWLMGGRFEMFVGRPLNLLFIMAVLAIAFFFGPLFCGWLCPVGSLTEVLSRQVPHRFKIDLSSKIDPAALRYGFFASYVLVAISTSITPESPVLAECCAPGTRSLAQTLGLASICCRYCASSQLQNIVDGAFNPGVLEFWHSGAILVLGVWLVLGGFLWQGGRGWCLYGCPLGALSNILHYIGSKLGFTYRVRHDATRCTRCLRCKDVCPTWAINGGPKKIEINSHTCNGCLECAKICDQRCYSYRRD